MRGPRSRHINGGSFSRSRQQATNRHAHSQPPPHPADYLSGSASPVLLPLARREDPADQSRSWEGLLLRTRETEKKKCCTRVPFSASWWTSSDTLKRCGAALFITAMAVVASAVWLRVAPLVFAAGEERRARTPLPQCRKKEVHQEAEKGCLLYTSPSPRDLSTSRMPSSA